MNKENKHRLIFILFVLAVPISPVLLLRAQVGNWEIVFMYLFPPLVSAEQLHKIITEKENMDDVGSAYAILAMKDESIAVETALIDVLSDDDYLWLNAASYLGDLGNEEAIPYLIKSLRHTAWRGDEERGRILQCLSGKDIGNDFLKWKEWWLSEGKNVEDSWWESSLGWNPRLNIEPVERVND